MDRRRVQRAGVPVGRGRMMRLLGVGAGLTAAWAVLCSGGCSEFDTPAPGHGLSVVAGPPMYKATPDIRVRVKNGASTASITGPGQFVVRTLGGANEPTVIAGPLTVTGSAGLLRIMSAGAAREFPAGVDVEILPRAGSSTTAPVVEPGGSAKTTSGKPAAATADPGLLKLDGVSYPGGMVVRADSGTGTVEAVASMSLEEYLPGVMVKELWSSFPKAAFEAQAIASRSYALHERDRARREGKRFDVEASTADQVYGGTTTVAVANKAVEDTRGIVLTEDGRLLRAYFSSTCGGRPASATDAWPSTGATAFNQAGPLQARRRDYACNSSKWYRWEVSRPDDELSARVRAWGKINGSEVGGLGRLRAIKVAARNQADRPARFILTDERGQDFKISAEDLRRACNYESKELPAVPATQMVRSGDLEAEFWANTVKIRGRGWGHGVGLCQWCAKGFADRRMQYPEILAKFYPGAELRRAY